MSATSSNSVYDVVGLGFGPANIAIAGALVEKWALKSDSNTTAPIQKVLFIERNDKFRWHPGMLLPDARMQISFMKDLATLRSPQSPITFLSYLHDQDRLLAFINRGSTIPTRKEFADYLSWAARYVQSKGVDVKYGHRVVALEDRHDGTIAVRIQNTSTWEETTIITRNFVISPGGSPRIPEVVSSVLPHRSIIHSSSYATSIEGILTAITASSAARPLSVAVIGSGQSAAEVTMDLRERLSIIHPGNESTQGHHIDMIIRKGSLKPSDDSPFANEIFDPCATDAWFSLPSDHMRAVRHAEYKNTNYGVVNPRTLENLYEIIYDQRLDDSIAKRDKCCCTSHKPRIDIRPYSSILSIQPGGPGHFSLRTVIQNSISRTVTEHKYDVIICATGYERASWQALLSESNLGKWFGLTSASDTVHLAPEFTRPLSQVTDQLRVHIDRANLAKTDPESNTPDNDSACSTPLTTPSPATPPCEGADGITQTVFVSRNYRLVPSVSSKESGELKARIYVQGVEEATHGLSDTLLSVMGIRAGEVVEDLWQS